MDAALLTFVLFNVEVRPVLPQPEGSSADERRRQLLPVQRMRSVSRVTDPDPDPQDPGSVLSLPGQSGHSPVDVAVLVDVSRVSGELA